MVASIEAAKGQTQLSMYTVPANKTAYLSRFDAIVDGNKAMDVFLFQRQNADDVTTPFTGKRLAAEFRQLIGSATQERISYSVFPEKTDLWASGVVGAGSGGITVTYDLILVDN